MKTYAVTVFFHTARGGHSALQVRVKGEDKVQAAKSALRQIKADPARGYASFRQIFACEVAA